MTGALFQLVGRGAQDTHLTVKPDITFFKSVYKRHTNFSKETVSHKFQNNTLFGNTAVINIPRNGDLITNSVKSSLHKYVSIKFGSLFNNFIYL